MLPTDLQSRLLSLLKAAAPPLLEVSASPVAAVPWNVGDRVQGTVLAALPNGRFQVQVGDFLLDLNLPPDTRPGEKPQLTLAAVQPRLAFLLARDLLPQGSSQVNLSGTARMLGNLLEKIAQHSGSPAAPAAEAVPLLPGAPQNGAELAQALRGALSTSGVFYESHQAQWVAGQKPLDDLLKEPQGRLSPLLSATTTEAASPQAPRATEQSMAATMPALPAPQSSPEETVHPQTVPLVQQQLQALETHHLLWQGQIWPGQQMEWRIEERGAQPEEEFPAWHTTLTLSFPNLGKVSARLVLAGNELRVSLQTGQPASETLASGQAQLRRALHDAGLNLTGFALEHRG